jgi:hypothetical protein
MNTKTKYIRILRDCTAPLSYSWSCGDGCCSETRWESQALNKGEEYEDGEIDVSDLTGGDDYDIIFK